MWDYQWMEWGLNPRTGQSMNMIQGPYGQIPANIFMQIPKDLYFMNSKEYCCKGNANTNYQQALANSTIDYYNALAKLYPCCTVIPNTSWTSGGC